MVYQIILGVLSLLLLFIGWQFYRVGALFFQQLGIVDYKGKMKLFSYTYLGFGIIGVILSFFADKMILFSFVIILLLVSALYSFILTTQIKK